MNINLPCSGQIPTDSVGNSYIIVPAKFFEDLCHWDRVHHIEDQKEFALSILDETPFCGLLFTARKLGKHPKEIFRESPDMIYKVLYK